MSSAENDSKPLPRVQVQLGPPWLQNMSEWFPRVESQFRLYDISQQITMRDSVASVLPEESSVKQVKLIASAAPTAYDDLKAAILEQVTMSISEKYAALHRLELGDRKPTELLLAIEKYAQGWVGEEFVKETLLAKLPSDVRPFLRMQPPSTTASESARMADKWATGNDDAPAIARIQKVHEKILP